MHMHMHAVEDILKEERKGEVMKKSTWTLLPELVLEPNMQKTI